MEQFCILVVEVYMQRVKLLKTTPTPPSQKRMYTHGNTGSQHRFTPKSAYNIGLESRHLHCVNVNVLLTMSHYIYKMSPLGKTGYSFKEIYVLFWSFL